MNILLVLSFDNFVEIINRDEICPENNPTYVDSNPEMSSADYLVAFSGKTESYCVGMVDMVNSTKMAATLGNARISGYYQQLISKLII